MKLFGGFIIRVDLHAFTISVSDDDAYLDEASVCPEDSQIGSVTSDSTPPDTS